MNMKIILSVLMLLVMSVYGAENGDVVKLSQWAGTQADTGAHTVVKSLGAGGKAVKQSVTNAVGAGKAVLQSPSNFGAITVGSIFNSDNGGYSIGTVYPVTIGESYMSLTYTYYNDYTYGVGTVGTKSGKSVRCGCPKKETSKAKVVSKPKHQQYSTVNTGAKALKGDIHTLDLTYLQNIFTVAKGVSLYAEAGLGINYNNKNDQVGGYIPVGVGVGGHYGNYIATVGYRHNVELHKLYLDEDQVVVRLGYIF